MKKDKLVLLSDEEALRFLHPAAWKYRPMETIMAVSGREIES